MGKGDSLKSKHSIRGELPIVSISRLKSQEGLGAQPQHIVENVFVATGRRPSTSLGAVSESRTAATFCALGIPRTHGRNPLPWLPLFPPSRPGEKNKTNPWNSHYDWYRKRGQVNRTPKLQIGGTFQQVCSRAWGWLLPKP